METKKRINEHQITKNMLDEVKKQNQIIIDKSPIAIELYDKNGFFLNANPACLSLFGVMNVSELEKFSLFDDPNISESHKSELRQGNSMRYESIFDFDKVAYLNLYNTSKTGQIILDTIISTTSSEDGAVSGYLLQIQDITQRKQIEETLRKSEERYRLAIAMLPDMLFYLDSKGKFLDCHTNEDNMLLLPKEVFIGKNLSEVMPPDIAELGMQAIERAVNNNNVECFEYELDMPNGRQFFEMRFLNSAPNEVLGIARNYTARHKMERSLIETEARYRALFNKSPDGMLIIDPLTMRFLEFNDSACKQLGYSREEFSDLCISDINVSETNEETRQQIQKAIDQGRDDFEASHRTKQGKIRNIHVTAQNINILGSPVYYCTWRDITEQKNDQAAIENYMHILTHDLRSAMGPILGFSDLLKEDGYSPEEVKNFAGIINDSGRKMLALMEGYLLLKKIECGQTVLSKKPKTIFEIIEEIKKIFVGLKSNGCNLRVIPASLLLGSIDFGFFQKMLSMDDVLFNSLITNLLNNAIEEATRRDKLINVDIHKEDDHIMLSFTNSGEIPHDIQSRLFQKFVSGKSSGTGIGLYSAKLIAEAHDWELIYRPLPGKTSFVIKIPDGPKL